MIDNKIAEIIAYYNDNDKLADKHRRLAAECAAAGNTVAAAKHETRAEICEARLDGLVSCLRMLGREVVFEGDSITIKY